MRIDPLSSRGFSSCLAAASLAFVAACSKESPPASSQSGQAATPTSPAATALAPIALSVPQPTPPMTTGAPAASGAAQAGTPTGTAAVDIAPHAIAETQGDDVSTWSLHAKGFPLVSEDGRRVVYVINEEDGMRAYPNYAGFVRGVADDKIQKRQPLFVANDLHKAERTKTLDAARAAIARNMDAFKPSWQASDLRPMAPMAPSSGGAGGAGGAGGPFTHGEWTVEWRDQRLLMTDKAGKKVLDHDAKVWKPKSFKLANGTACSFEPKLAAAYVYPAKNVLLVTLAFVEVAGGDSCNLSDDVRVLVWK